MKQKSAKIFLMIAILVIPLTLSGCKKKCPKPSENIPGTSTYRDDCPFDDSQAAQTGQRTLDLWVVFDNTESFQEQLQEFQSNTPGVKVNVKKFTNLEEYEDLVINEIAEGEGPDVFMIHNSWMTKHYKKLLPLPLDQPIVVTPDIFRKTFFQAAADDLILDDKIYGMPLSIDNLAVFYNKQQFKDLIATTDRPAELWEGIKEQTATLTAKNNSPERFALSGIALGRADNISSAVDILYAMLLQYGVKFYDEKEEKATFASNQTGSSGVTKPGVEAFKLFTSFGLPSYRHYSWNEYITGFAPEEKEVSPFVREKVSMIIGYPYLYQEITQSIQNEQKKGNQHVDIEDVGIVPLPQLLSGEEATKLDNYASYFPLVVARTTDMTTEAWSLVQYLTSQDALQTYHKKTNRPTSRQDMVTEQQTEPLFGSFAHQARFSKSIRVYDDAAYRKVFSDAIQEVVNNTATPEEALSTAETKITCIIQKQKGIIDAGDDCGI